MKFKPHHTAISVRNQEKSLEFYTKLGFKQVHFYDDGEKSNTHLELDGFYIEMFCFHKNKDAEELENEYANDIDELGVKHIALSVEDVDETLKYLRGIGLADESTVISGKGKARFFFVKDPDGVWVEFIRDDRY